MRFYRTWASLGVLLGLNVAVWLFKIPVAEDLLLGNHLMEAAGIFAIVSLLVDLHILDGRLRDNYLYVGFVALLIGMITVVAGFSSLFLPATFISMAKDWFMIAPQIIFLIGVPSLYFADKLSKKSKFLTMENVGKRGILNVFLVTIVYTNIVVWFLFTRGWLRLG